MVLAADLQGYVFGDQRDDLWCRNLSELAWVSTAGVCGFGYVAVAIFYQGITVRRIAVPSLRLHAAQYKCPTEHEIVR